MKPAETEEVLEPKVAMGIVPCLNDLYVSAAWKVIKPIEEQFVKDSMEEYSLMEVWTKIFYGQAFLYMGYLDPTGKITEDQNQPFILGKLATNPLDNFVGFILLRFDPNAIFVWQVYIDQKFQNTNLIPGGLEWLKKLAKEKGAPYLSFSSYRKQWEKVAPRLGFSETYSVFRCKLD